VNVPVGGFSRPLNLLGEPRPRAWLAALTADDTFEIYGFGIEPFAAAATHG